MDEIVPRLFLCSWTPVATGAVPEDAFVVNCTKDLPLLHMRHHRVPVDDNGDPREVDELARLLPGAVQAIEAALADSRVSVVVVHCRAGQQRSAAVVAAYLMKALRLQVAEAIRFVCRHRSTAFFGNVNFRAALETWALALRE